jgi:long-chain acyl-CoA synthetase
VEKWASQNVNNSHITPPFESNSELKQIILDDMIREGKRHGLMSYEQVKIIEFVNEPFAVENGLLTPTFKMRRYAIEKEYKKLFEKIYNNAKD